MQPILRSQRVDARLPESRDNKNGRESRGTRNQELQCWRRPEASRPTGNQIYILQTGALNMATAGSSPQLTLVT
jgi:hypothetical protein